MHDDLFDLEFNEILHNSIEKKFGSTGSSINKFLMCCFLCETMKMFFDQEINKNDEINVLINKCAIELEYKSTNESITI